MEIVKIISELWKISLISAFVISFFSRGNNLMREVGYKRKGWRKYRTFYSLKELKEGMSLTEDLAIKRQFRRVIILNRISSICLYSTPVFIVLNELIKQVDNG